MNRKHFKILVASIAVGSAWFWFPRVSMAHTGGMADGGGPACTTEKGRAALKAMYEKLYAPAKGRLKELEKGTNYFFHGRAREALAGVSEADWDQLFDPARGGLSKEEFDDLFWLVKSGDVKATREQEQMIEELRHMVDDYGPVFWTMPNRGYHIKRMLEQADAAHGFESAPDAPAQALLRALERTEVEVVARAMGESFGGKKYVNSRWYDKIARFFAPYYYPMVDVLKTHNDLRRRLQLMFMADEPVSDAIGRYSTQLALEPAELEPMRGLIANTGKELGEVRKVIADLHGRELTIGDPVKEAEIRIRDLRKRALATNADDAFSKTVADSRHSMDVLDSAITRARAKRAAAGDTSAQGPRPFDEYHDRHLQIRYPQHIEETEAGTAHYFGITAEHPEDAAYNVKSEWTVTTRHTETWQELEHYIDYEHHTTTDSNGHSQTTTTAVPKTRWVTKTDTWYTRRTEDRIEPLLARVEEVLDNHVTPRESELAPLPYPHADSAFPRHGGSVSSSASNGSPSIVWSDTARISKILSAGAQARASEAPYRDLIAGSLPVVDSVTVGWYRASRGNAGELDKMMAALDGVRSSLRKVEPGLRRYSDRETDEIRRQWRHDRPENFTRRNKQMTYRYYHLAHRVDHLHEQLRRRIASLEIEFDTRTYDEQMAALKKLHERYRLIQGVTGGVLALGVVGGVVAANQYPEEYQKLKDGISEKFEKMKSMLPGGGGAARTPAARTPVDHARASRLEPGPAPSPLGEASLTPPEVERSHGSITFSH